LEAGGIPIVGDARCSEHLRRISRPDDAAFVLPVDRRLSPALEGCYFVCYSPHQMCAK
jgi:hypothetical protein